MHKNFHFFFFLYNAREFTLTHRSNFRSSHQRKCDNNYPLCLSMSYGKVNKNATIKRHISLILMITNFYVILWTKL